MRVLQIVHATTYRYASAVQFGEHRLMVRPRDSHDIRLVEAELTLSPPGVVRWLHDVFGNSVAIVTFAHPAPELRIVSRLTLERYGLNQPGFPLHPDAATYPFVYSANDRTDLGRLLERHYPDPKEVVDTWARRFVTQPGMFTLDLLSTINSAIHSSFTYETRDQEGTQSPTDTLERGAGSCRDLALLLIEAVRSLGFGARFVTGYLFDPVRNGDGVPDVKGAGATHAWADIYLPGAGWIEYDPTNGLVAGENLIRVAVTRDPSQALPLAGSFIGDPFAFQGMEVEVTVTET
jgi:transglutaminase-like putative cysteine protease